MNEKELRKKIREELKQYHERQEERDKNSSDREDTSVTKDLYHTDHYQDYRKEAIIRAVEEEICSRYPEMVECENHLGEVRWLTPLELHEGFEFYPREKSLVDRIKNKLFKTSPVDFPDTPEWKKFIDDLRAEMQEDIRQRVEIFKKRQIEAQKHRHSEIESKIYEEEIDRFYKAKKGYKKYKNHLGEFRWMTKEEAGNQEEFFEEELSLLSKWIIRMAIAVFVLAIGAASWYYFTGNGYKDRGYILLEGDFRGGSLYIDKNLAPGFKYNVPYPISAGSHEVSIIRDGFITMPPQKQVNIQKDDTVSLRFDFEAHASATMGHVRILNNITDARIYVDDDFYGNLIERDMITLKAGQHTISLEKDGYRSNPSIKKINLSAGDTLEVAFTMRSGDTRGTPGSDPGAAKLGLIEVRSNVKNADIYVNGEKTEYKTDYVLQKMAFGQYVISVQKQGYQSYPEERVVKVNRKDMRGVANFTLSSTSTMVTLKTKPIAGEIFINSKPVGSGEFKGSLPIGEHQISFGEVNYYAKPADQIIAVDSDGMNVYEFEYTTNLKIEMKPDGIYPANLAGRIISGHVFNNLNIIPDEGNGPELKSVRDFDEKVWYIGYTFQYRNPPGKDALEFTFNIPTHLDLSQPLHLRAWVYRSGTNYPIVMSGNAYYQIIVNGNTFREKILPKHSLKEISEDHFDEFRINEYLKRGLNTIFIASTDDTSEEVALWKLSIQ